MKMKAIVCVLSACFLTALASGCGQVASAETSDKAQGTTASQMPGESVEPQMTDSPSDADGIMGKIISVSSGEITVATATVGGGPEKGDPPTDMSGEEPPAGFDSGENSERPEPIQGESGAEPPQGGGPGGGGGGPGGGGGAMQFGEEVTYTVSDDATVTSGMGEDSTSIALTDLNADDIVRLDLDDDGVVVTISRIDNMDNRMEGTPPDTSAGTPAE